MSGVVQLQTLSVDTRRVCEMYRCGVSLVIRPLLYIRTLKANLLIRVPDLCGNLPMIPQYPRRQMAAIHVGNDAGTSVVVRDVALEAMPYSLVRVRITVQAGELFGRVRCFQSTTRRIAWSGLVPANVDHSNKLPSRPLCNRGLLAGCGLRSGTWR